MGLKSTSANPLGRPKLYDTYVKVQMTSRQRDAVETEATARGIPVSQVLRDLINSNLLEADS